MATQKPEPLPWLERAMTAIIGVAALLSWWPLYQGMLGYFRDSAGDLADKPGLLTILMCAGFASIFALCAGALAAGVFYLAIGFLGEWLGKWSLPPSRPSTVSDPDRPLWTYFLPDDWYRHARSRPDPLSPAERAQWELDKNFQRTYDPDQLPPHP